MSLILLVRFSVTEQLPLPARTAVGVVQAALKVKRPAAQQLIHSGCVTCSGRIILQSHIRLQVGDCVEIQYAPQPVRAAKIDSGAGQRFEIVYDDDSLIVVNKPAGLLTVPTPKRESNTLQGQLRKWLARQQPGAQAICVHRLDRLVSGLLVFAKSFEMADQIRAQFEKRKPERQYTAIVSGHLDSPSGSIRSYLSTDQQLTRVSSLDPSAGELAITHYTTTERWKDVSLLQVRLETGRRNQIRVHLADLGHPILGDPRYRPEQAEHVLWPYKRIALHAETLSILHPVTGELLRLAAPWPQEFRDLRKQLGHRRV